MIAGNQPPGAAIFKRSPGKARHLICLSVSLAALWPAAAAATCDGIEVVTGTLRQCVRPKETFRDCAACPQMTVIPPGEFQMGSSEEEIGHTSTEAPKHQVRIGYHLAIATYEATFEEWDACVSDGGCAHRPRDSGWGRGRRPVINVSWHDIVNEYLPWLSKKTGQTYRLLTEAEWEYAARASSETPFATGQTISTHDANYDGTAAYGSGVKGEYRKRTVEVGSFAPNKFGLHDMHGNVWEWVQDCSAATYAQAPSDGRAAGEVAGCQRVMRGGSWIDSPRVVRSATRGRVPADTRFIYRGFRVARTI